MTIFLFKNKDRTSYHRMTPALRIRLIQTKPLKQKAWFRLKVTPANYSCRRALKMNLPTIKLRQKSQKTSMNFSITRIQKAPRVCRLSHLRPVLRQRRKAVKMRTKRNHLQQILVLLTKGRKNHRTCFKTNTLKRMRQKNTTSKLGKIWPNAKRGIKVIKWHNLAVTAT